MKKYFGYFIVAVMFLSVAITSCKKDKDEVKVMTMTTESDKVSFSLIGSGIITIDWGDGTEMETHTLVPTVDMGDYITSKEYLFSHSYSGISIRIIKITGENITRLDCSDNQLTSLDISKNTVLSGLHCNNNQLTSLDVSKNTALVELFCWNNQLMSLDVSKNTLLSSLQCGNNQLTSLDVSKNTMLLSLQCAINQITNLDVSKNLVLNSLYCYNNKLMSMDVSKNTILIFLQCINNQLDSAALNALFGTLHDNIFEWSKYLYIGGNPGANSCDQSIAKDKGWTVY